MSSLTTTKHGPKPTPVTPKWFWSNVRIILDQSSCWIWQRKSAVRGGYGVFERAGFRMQSHRYALVCTRGLDVNLHVLHKCDNPKCCRPSHLFQGTQDTNMKDMATKWRSGRSKLTKDQVLAIKSGTDHLSLSDTARKYGVTCSAIEFIRKGENYAHV